MKLLVVDDDALVIASCRRILEAEGFDIATAGSADEALEIAQSNRFDLLLVDVKMPRRDGVFFVKEIRKKLPRVPVVVMSGYPTPDTVADVMSAGATRFIPKPFRPDELVRLVRQALHRASDT